jgi:hypothetical protein
MSVRKTVLFPLLVSTLSACSHGGGPTSGGGSDAGQAGSETAGVGFDSGRAGSETASGGVETASGGADLGRAGSETASGGVETASGGADLGRAGTDTAGAGGGPTPPPADGLFTDIASASGFADIRERNGDVAQAVDDVWCFDITVEDIDGDGNNDIFLGGHGAYRALAWGDGRGRFTEQRLPECEAQTWSQLAFDFDNDGLTDFSQNWDSADFPLMHNLGDREFAVVSPEESIHTGANGMAWSDWNGDGNPDYLVDGFQGNHVYGGGADGSFDVVADSYGLFGSTDTAEATLFAADLTGDDLPDLLLQPLEGNIFTGGGHQTLLAENTTAPLGGSSSFSEVGDSGLDALPGPAVALGDYDNDGDLDVFGMGSASDSTDTLRYSLFRNDGAGHFTDVTAASGLPTEGRTVNVYVVLYFQSLFLDYDGDGLLDILAVEEDRDRLFRNLGGGRFQEVTAAHGLDGDRVFGRPARFAAGDLDGDHDVDFVTMRSENDQCTVQLWRNDVASDNGLVVKLVGKQLKNALNSKLSLYEAKADGSSGRRVAYREVLLSTTHRAPLEQYFALPTGKIYNLSIKFWPSGTVVDRAGVEPGRLVITEP